MKLSLDCVMNLFRFRSVILILMIAMIAACSDAGNGDKKGKINSPGGFNAPTAIQLDLLPPGLLKASFKIDDNEFVDMQLNGTQAGLIIDNLTPGEHTFSIRWEYISDDFGLVLLAEASKLLVLVEGDNNLSFQDSDYNTSTIDSDDDGLSNLAELEANTNPFDGVCIFDVSLFDSCDFVNG